MILLRFFFPRLTLVYLRLSSSSFSSLSQVGEHYNSHHRNIDEVITQSQQHSTVGGLTASNRNAFSSDHHQRNARESDGSDAVLTATTNRLELYSKEAYQCLQDQ